MKTICFIPARGGSVRIPRKNIRPFHGKPIIAYSIENAQKCGLFDQVVVSTDDAEIAYIALHLGAERVWRERDDGTIGTQELAGAYLKTRLDVGACCVLYATAPLLTWRHLMVGWRMLQKVDESVYAVSVDYDIADIGAFYWGWAQAFRDGLPLALREEPWNSAPVYINPGHCCDINTEEDWQRAESMYEALRRANGD